MLISYPTDYPPGLGLHLVLALAWVIDAVLGDPAWLYRYVPHPVALLGRVIGRADDALNDERVPAASRRVRGIFVVAVIVAGCGGLGWLLGWVLRAGPDWLWVGEAIAVSTLIACRGLYDHVRAVATGLEAGIEAGRRAVAHIVGRDPESLDESGVARAAIESTAENFSDGVVAPVLFYVVFGLPGLFAYKAINTLDSMVGHRTERHEAFGWAAARLDDFVNLPASRLAGAIFALAGVVTPDSRGADALRAMLRDASKHRSPNAGWPEAAVAGALGLALAGPRVYGAHRVEDSWMGDGRREATASDIRRALRLYIGAGAITVTLGFIALLP